LFDRKWAALEFLEDVQAPVDRDFPAGICSNAASVEIWTVTPYGPKTGSVSIPEIPGSAAGAARDNWVTPMPRVLDPFRFLLITLAGWMNQRQLLMIDYLREENRVTSRATEWTALAPQRWPALRMPNGSSGASRNPAWIR
jgi:hypothetical protein